MRKYKVFGLLLVCCFFAGKTVEACPGDKTWAVTVYGSGSDSGKRVLNTKPGRAFYLREGEVKCVLSEPDVTDMELVNKTDNTGIKHLESVELKCDFPGEVQYKEKTFFTIYSNGVVEEKMDLPQIQIGNQLFELMVGCASKSKVVGFSGEWRPLQ